MNLNQIRIERVIYGYLDWLGDIGGFLEALSLIGILVLSFITYKPFEGYFAREMYTYAYYDNDDDSKRPPDNKDDPNQLKVKSAEVQEGPDQSIDKKTKSFKPIKLSTLSYVKMCLL